MQVFVELFLFRVEEAELADRLAEAIERRPEQARDVLFLLRGDPRVEPLSAPSLLTRDDKPAEMVIGRKAAGEDVDRLCAWEVIARMEVGEIEVSLDLERSMGAEIDWSGTMSLDDAFMAVVLEPGLLLVASPALLADEASVAPFWRAKLEREKQLKPLLNRPGAVRRAVDSLLEEPAPR